MPKRTMTLIVETDLADTIYVFEAICREMRIMQEEAGEGSEILPPGLDIVGMGVTKTTWTLRAGEELSLKCYRCKIGHMHPVIAGDYESYQCDHCKRIFRDRKTPEYADPRLQGYVATG